MGLINKKKFVSLISVFAFILIIIGVSFTTAFWPFDWFKNIFSGKSITGNAAGGYGYGYGSMACSDSDVNASYSDGKNYYIRGDVLYNGVLKIDGCYNSTRLNEYYCYNNGLNYNFMFFDCPFGCINGACLKTGVNTGYGETGYGFKATGYGSVSASGIQCFDSDNGTNYYIKGFVKDKYTSTFPYGALTDSCAVKNSQGNYEFVSSCNNAGAVPCYLSEYYCATFDNHNVFFLNCSYGCSNGACLKTPINTGYGDDKNKSVLTTKNSKNMTKYSDREVFLISDRNWKDVLSLVPLTTWTGNEKDCVRGYGTPENVCVYPTLIWHEETGQSNQYRLNTIKKEDILVNYIPLPKYLEDNNIYYSTKSLKFDKQVLFEGEETSLSIIFSSASKDKDNIPFINIIQINNLPREYLKPINILCYGYNKDSESFELDCSIADDGKISITNPNNVDYITIGILETFKLVKMPPEGFDADSIIYFTQQYQNGWEKVTIAGQTPQELDNLLIAQPELGAGINQDNIKRISPENYLSYWQNISEIVYVEDNYELALMASTYASLINAPLIIKESSYGTSNNLMGRDIICVGDVVPFSTRCKESYNLEQLQKKYVELTKTDKIILVNPDDLSLKVEEVFQPEKSTNIIRSLYSGTSLSAPILAGAKHEIILSNSSQDFNEIRKFLIKKINNIVPYLINKSDGIKADNFEDVATYHLYEETLNNNNLVYNFHQLPWGDKFKISSSRLLWVDQYHLYLYDLYEKKIKKIPLLNDKGHYPSEFGLYSGGVVFFENDYQQKSCLVNVWESKNEQISTIMVYGGYCQSFINNEGYLLFIKENESGICYNSGEYCSLPNDCKLNYCINSQTKCQDESDCPEEDFCLNDNCKKDIGLYLYNFNTKQTSKINPDDQLFGNYGFDRDKIWWISSYPDNTKKLNFQDLNTLQNVSYDLDSKDPIQVYGNFTFFLAPSDENGINSIFSYNYLTKEKEEIAKVESKSPNLINDGKLLWLSMEESADKRCRVYDNKCNSDADCRGKCVHKDYTCFKDSDCGFDESAYCIKLENLCQSTSLYLYDIESKEKKEISSGKIIDRYIFQNNTLYYISPERYNYTIFGFLTVFASPAAIPQRELIIILSGIDYARSLDHTEYGDIYLNDLRPDVSVGRIQGITLSDVSSYVARDLFYNRANNTGHLQFLASSFDNELKLASKFTGIFKRTAYKSDCSINPTITEDGGSLICEITKDDIPWPKLWKENDILMYMDHGSPISAGILWVDIPFLNNSIIIDDACSTCSTFDQYSFCNNVIRKGGLGHMGAVSVAWYGNTQYAKTLEGMFKDNYTLGQSFAKSYLVDDLRYMTTLLGDPTFDIKKPYKLQENLLWEF